MDPLETTATQTSFPRSDTASLIFSEQNEYIDILFLCVMTHETLSRRFIYTWDVCENK